MTLVASETTSFQWDAGHSGGVVDPALDGPLKVVWTQRLSCPLAAGGRVFVVSQVAGETPSGRSWRRRGEAGVAADDQGVYLGTECGWAFSFSHAGAQRWSTRTACPGEVAGFAERAVVADGRALTDARGGAVLDTRPARSPTTAT